MAKTKKSEQVNDISGFTKKYTSVLVDKKKLTRTRAQLLRSGSIKIDGHLRGGLRAGTISEWFGTEGGGKSTIALMVTKWILDNGGTVLYLDLEKGLDGGVDLESGHIDGWMEIIGINPEHPNLQVARPITGEAAYEMIEDAIKADIFDLIVLDSMASLIPLADLEGNIGESAFGKVAKLNSEALKRVMAAYDAQKVERTHLFVVNQAREQMNSPSLKSTGGRALRHFVGTKQRATRVGSDPALNVSIVRIRTIKSRFSPFGEEIEIYIHPELGIDLQLELIELGQDDGFIQRSGAWYTVADPTTGEELIKVQGKQAVKDWFTQNPDMFQLLHNYLYEKMLNSFIKNTAS